MNQQNSLLRLKSDLKGFNTAFNSLPRNKLIHVRQLLMYRLHWSVSLFYYKKRGDTPIWEHEIPVIDDIFSRYRINYRTGEELNH